MMNQNHDFRVMGTAQDAVKAKYATVQAGYFQDPFVAPFVVNAAGRAAGPAPARPPVQVIIKRGTFARVACVEGCIRRFLGLVAAAASSENGENAKNVAQVVVVGAGKDTAFFRIMSMILGHSEDDASAGCSASLPLIHENMEIRWFEVDHGQVLREKAAVLEQSPGVFGATSVRLSKSESTELYKLKAADDQQSRLPRSTLWNGKNVSCHWIAHDLKEDPGGLLRNKLIDAAGLDPHAPTLVVVECVQMYLPVHAVNALWGTIATTLTDCHVCSYEPIVDGSSCSSSTSPTPPPPSAFGRMMQANLTQAGVVQPDSCLVQRRTLAEYLDSFVQHGFARAVGCDMYTAYETLLTPAQRQRASRCEFLDELEEWMLIMRHYSLVVASNNVESNVGNAFTIFESTSPSSSSSGNGGGFVQGRCQFRERPVLP